MSKVYKATRPQEKETKEKVLSIYEIFMMRVLKIVCIRSDKWLQTCEVANYSAMKLEIFQITQMLKVLELMAEAYKHKQVFTYIHSKPICMKLVNTKVQLVSVSK